MKCKMFSFLYFRAPPHRNLHQKSAAYSGNSFVQPNSSLSICPPQIALSAAVFYPLYAPNSVGGVQWKCAQKISYRKNVVWDRGFSLTDLCIFSTNFSIISISSSLSIAFWPKNRFTSSIDLKRLFAATEEFCCFWKKPSNWSSWWARSCSPWGYKNDSDSFYTANPEARLKGAIGGPHLLVFHGIEHVRMTIWNFSVATG